MDPFEIITAGGILPVIKVESIDYAAFSGCDSLTEVKLNNAKNTWAAAPREDRTAPTLIFLHSSVGRAHDC